MNYASITALMAVESSFIPFPSEVVIPPAAFVAGQPESVLCVTGNYLMDVLFIILFGTLGAMIGAIINYGLSVLAEKLKEDEGYFYNKNSFLDIFKDLTRPKQDEAEDEDVPESLD